MCLKGRPSVVIYELRANSISNGLLHFVTGDKRAGHTLSPLNELTRPRKNTPCLSHIYIHCRNTHTSTIPHHTPWTYKQMHRKIKTLVLSSTHKHMFTHASHSLPRTPLPPEPPSTDRRSARLLPDTSPGVKGQLSSVKSREVLRAPWCVWRRSG